MTARFVVAALGAARSVWLRDLARAATGGAVPVELVLCMSAGELRARVGSGRRFSALLLDAVASGVDRDLVDLARDHDIACIVVGDGRPPRDWSQLGVDLVLDAGADVATIVEALRATARPVERVDVTGCVATVEPPPRVGSLVAVCGPGGTGASIVAMAIAQALGSVHPRPVLLADCALRAAQGVLHRAPDVVPALSELVLAHRGATANTADLASYVFDVEGRGYHLLLGLRRARDWSALRPRALDAAIGALRAVYGVVVADVDHALDGFESTGSTDVEERHHLARSLVTSADLVVLVGAASCVGIHGLARLAGDVLDLGVEPGRLVLVVNHASRRPGRRAEATRAIAGLVAPLLDDARALPPVVFVAHRPEIEASVRDGRALPRRHLDAVTRLVARALSALDRPSAPEPEPVRPGSLGFAGVETSTGSGAP